jgi:Asp-tRNA(Asn)/Glu-tRNA(Gln) amidotransferase C subunit
MTTKEQLKRLIEMLRFVLTTDDLDIIKPTVESVIDTLEDINQKPRL